MSGPHPAHPPAARSWLTPAILAQLRSDPWFSHLPPEFEAELLAVAVQRRLQAGEHLFFRGDPPDGLYAILEGSLRISGVTEAGKEAILSLIDAPAWFGEISAFDQLPRTHNACAEGAVRVLHIPHADLMALLARQPLFWRELGVLMALRMRLAFINMEDMALLPSEVRLARRLVWLVEASGQVADVGPWVVPISQTQLGMMLSLSRQTTNQAVSALASQGLVRVAYGRIEVLDRVRLMEAAALSDTERQILAQLRASERR
ncbi:Crp/Fnr family transcriptional regulator [Aquabacterium sp. A3]|uniref:Crp/Fnr family transcriptional regulator n=1 Tax=Aquabacterium sp. A3 TaxID=3132829 RepID=UPI00311A83EC